MPMFICDRCEAVENTALGAYWCRKPRGLPRLCSECHTGEWHDRFPKRTYSPAVHALDDILNPPEAA